MNWQQTIKLLLLIAVTSNTTPLFSQNMYPGDVNNNGIVNGVDFLYLAHAYNEVGANREKVGSDYVSTPTASDWSNYFTNGINHSYADCNGNGRVNHDDISAGVIANFGKTHGNITEDAYVNGIPDVSPTLVFESVEDEGNVVDISVRLENGKNTIDDFYGLTFDIKFPSELLSEDPVSFALPNNAWFAQSPRDKRHIVVTTKSDAGELIVTVAISRIDGAISTGQGVMGQFKVITEAIDLYRTSEQAFKVENVMVVKNDLTVIPVNVVQ